MGLVREGGYVVIATDKTLIHRSPDIDEKTLYRVAEALGIPKAEREQMVAAGIRSIYVYLGGTGGAGGAKR